MGKDQPIHRRKIAATLVESIDANSTPLSPEVKEIYRPIKGNWYLFYHSDN